MKKILSWVFVALILGGAVGYIIYLFKPVKADTDGSEVEEKPERGYVNIG